MSWIPNLPEVIDGGFVDETDYNNILNNVRNIYERILAVEAQTGGGIPLNGACLWYGLASQVPNGWHIMDGTNGLLNMLSKFVMGASADGDVGVTGGASSHLHTNQSLPVYSTTHNHAISINTATNSPVYYGYGDNGSEPMAGSHTHPVTGNTGENGAHNHTVSNTSSDASLPPYKQLYWIGRTS
jgi:hypothetical protein